MGDAAFQYSDCSDLAPSETKTSESRCKENNSAGDWYSRDSHIVK